MSYSELVREITAPPTSPPITSDSSTPNGFKLIPNRIFVGGMSRETTEEDLLRYFASYGNVKSAKIITDINTGASKGYGFVTFGSEEEALLLQKFGGIAILHNRKLNIGPAIKRNVATTTTTTGVDQGVAGVAACSNVVSSSVKPTEPSPDVINALAGGYPNSGLLPGLSMDPATAMLYQPFYGFPFSYFYPGSPAFQFPY